MALKIAPAQHGAEDVILRIQGTFEIDPDRASLHRIRRALSGGDSELPATRAMALLFASDFPNMHRDFESLLEDETAPEVLRRLSAVYLGRLQTPEAVDALTSHLGTRDESILAAILQGLGKAGGRPAIDAIAKLRSDLPPSTAREADIAAALIAHRLGIDGHEFPIPAELRYSDLDETCAARLEFTPAGRNDVEFCLRSLGRRPFGIELSEHSVFQFRCQRQIWMVLFNRALALATLAAAIEKKAMPGIVAARNQETGLYSEAYALLTLPVQARRDIRILACRANGDVILGGNANVRGDRVQFTLRATARPGAFAVSLEGAFENGSIRIQKALASRVPQVPRRRPVAE